MTKNFGKYQVIKELGKGAMGVVYLAYDSVLERQVAIKTIASSESDQDLKERFIREARSAGKLRHNNIITIYDLGEEGEQLFIAMEYLEGRDLDSIIASHQKLDMKQKLDILRQICLGLDYAHRNNIYHRDIKPANIKILQDGTVKIMDFGLATMQTSGLTKTGTIMGTPHYMSPEMIQERKIDGRSDQFAVGVILYELLTYSRPFQGDTISTILYNILNSEPKAFDSRLTGQYPELQRIAEKAMKKNVESRYPTMKAMADDLESLQHKMIKRGFQTDKATMIMEDSMKTVLMDTELDVSKPEKKEKPKIGSYIGIGLAAVILIAAALYFFVFSKSAAPPGFGYLSFNIKPWAKIEKIENLKTNEVKTLQGDSAVTPVRVALAPGRYKIIYKNPKWTGLPLSKEFTITAQNVTEIKGSMDDSFATKAIENFTIK